MHIGTEDQELVFRRAREPVAIAAIEQDRAEARRRDGADKAGRRGRKGGFRMAIAAAQGEVFRDKPVAVELEAVSSLSASAMQRRFAATLAGSEKSVPGSETPMSRTTKG